MTIMLLRHGETIRPGHFCGSTDIELSALGWQQMHAAAQQQTWHRIVSSPLRRCADFAQQLGRQINLEVTLDARWSELDFGTWEGLSPSDVAATRGAALARFWADPQQDPPPHDGEPWSLFQTRVLDAWRALERLTGEQRVLVVTHGGVIRLLLGHARGLPASELLSIDVPHASLHHLSCAPIA